MNWLGARAHHSCCTGLDTRLKRLQVVSRQVLRADVVVTSSPCVQPLSIVATRLPVLLLVSESVLARSRQLANCRMIPLQTFHIFSDHLRSVKCVLRECLRPTASPPWILDLVQSQNAQPYHSNPKSKQNPTCRSKILSNSQGWCWATSTSARRGPCSFHPTRWQSCSLHDLRPRLRWPPAAQRSC